MTTGNKLMIGNLGNQMFQYSFMLSLKKLGLIDNINLIFVDKFNNGLVDFNIDANVIGENELNISRKQNKILERHKKINYYLFRLNMFRLIELRTKLLKRYFLRNGLIVGYREYQDYKKIYKQNNIVFGYFEDPKFYNDYKEHLREVFTPIHPKLCHNKELYNQIENSNSVCISIRCGDFLTSKYVHDRMYVCDKDYFEKAISIMQEKINNPTFIVFSDDIDWCKNNIDFPNGTLFEEGNDPSYEKLRLMYSCKHFIISNSTFSWWAQFLSKNENKIVIAPKSWRRKKEDNLLNDKNWIKI